MKRLLAFLVAAAMVLSLPLQAMAAKMEENVPVWNEETVRQYLNDYVQGKNMDVLYGYYDLQIRRYLPESTFRSMLTELEWLTGDFICLGEYSSFEESARNSMTHVVHLHMEKQDLDVYFTHKNYEDDWEVMALEFVPAAKQEIDVGFAVDAQPTVSLAYEEIPVVVGEGTAYALNGLITLPAGVEEGKTVPGCVLVHDAGALDMNAAVGATQFFAELAHELADMGIASIRYDKRTFVYEETAAMTVQTEVLDDAALAMELLAEHEAVMDDGIVLIGHGFGAHMVPFVAAESKIPAAGMILIGSRPIAYAEQLLQKTDLSGMSKEEITALKELVAYIGDYTEEQARGVELFGRNGTYFRDLDHRNHINQIMRLAIPTYIVQGRNDADATENDGWRAYAEELKNYGQFVDYNSYRGLNHMLANDLSVDENGRPQYALDAGINVPAVRDLADWIMSQFQEAEATEVE